MSKKIIYSLKEYQEKYNSLLNKFLLDYKESEEIDFIIYEIEKYNICLKLVNLTIEKAFSKWFRIEYGTPLDSFDISREEYNFIFENENDSLYYKIYNDLVEPAHQKEKTIDHRTNIKQTRIVFPKIISFLKDKKKEIESKSNNPYPLIFTGDDDRAFQVFKDFISETNCDFLDFSFIFQKMKHKTERLIIAKYPHLLFMDWLFENKFINDRKLDVFKGKGSFSSKADTGKRSPRYYSIKDKYFNSDSD